MAVLSLDRSYTDIRPRRPEGGPDGGRDIECKRLGERCFGAVGFMNSVNDSREHKSRITSKFESDVRSARDAALDVKAFVFLTNVDLTPAEVDALVRYGQDQGLSHVDVYWRERLRIALDNVEGFGFRFQYLDIPMSDPEQAAFFARFGKELEELLHGRFDRIERKLDAIQFDRWKTGYVRSVSLSLQFHDDRPIFRDSPQHFRVALELREYLYNGRRPGFIFGGRDVIEPPRDGSGKHGISTTSFFWDGKRGNIADSWSKGARVVHSYLPPINLGVSWHPRSNVRVIEFDDLYATIFVTENLVPHVRQVSLAIDDYVVLDWKLTSNDFSKRISNIGWPDELSEDEVAIPWFGHSGREVILSEPPVVRK